MGTVRKLIILCLAVLTAGLMLIVASCGSKSPSPAETGPEPAAKLVFTQQPDKGTAGSYFDTQPVVAVEDAGGNLVTGYNGYIELTLASGDSNIEAQLLGGIKTAVKDGKAEFQFLSIDKAGTGYTLTASSGSLTPAVSRPFDILPGDAVKLAFVSQPAGGIAGKQLTPYPEVIVQDIKGNTVTSFQGSISLRATWDMEEKSDPYQAQTKLWKTPVVLMGTTTVEAVNGVARFTDVYSPSARPNHKLIASSGSLAQASSAYFTVLPGEPAQLDFSIHPDWAVAGWPFETQPKVVVEDAYHNVVTSSRADITVSITPGSGTGGAVLSGTSTMIADDAMGGLAEFEDLSIDLPGTGYTLTATAEGLKPTTGLAFDVLEPPPLEESPETE